MGCGASTQAAAASQVATEQQRDPEDYSLDPIQLQVTNIEEFDAVFGRLQELLNRLVDLNNGVNEAVAEVKAAYAVVSGAYQVQVSIGPSTDIVLVDLFTFPKGSGARLRQDEVQRLLEDADIRMADSELEKARVALNDHLAASETRLPVRVSKDGFTIEVPDMPGESAPVQVQKLNACLTKLKILLGTRAYMHITAKPALAFGTPTVQARVLRPPLGEEGPLESVPMMEACASTFGVSLKDAEAFLVDRAQVFALRTKGIEGLDLHIVSGHRLQMGDPDAITNDDTRDQVVAVLQAVNVALFKLLNSAASSREPASLSNAVVEVLRPVLMLLKQQHVRPIGSAFPSVNLKELITANPAVEFRKEEDGSPPTFDFNFNVQLTEEAGIAAFPECLPEKAATLLETLDHLKIIIAEALLDLPPISEDVDIALEDAKEFYELCPDAAARKGLSMMEAVKCSKATGSNLRMLYTTQDLFLAFGENVKRVADELAASTSEVQNLMDEMLVVNE